MKPGALIPQPRNSHLIGTLSSLSRVDHLTELALAAQDRGFEAVQAFIKASEPDVRRFCGVIGRRSETDDLVQETFIRASLGLPHFRGEGSARSWLLGIAHHVCMDDHRRAGQWLAVIDRARHAQRAETTSHRGGLVEIEELLRSLSDDRREAFVLTQIHGLSYDEAATISECAVGTIRSRVARARTELIKMIRAAEAS